MICIQKLSSITSKYKQPISLLKTTWTKDTFGIQNIPINWTIFTLNIPYIVNCNVDLITLYIFITCQRLNRIAKRMRKLELLGTSGNYNVLWLSVDLTMTRQVWRQSNYDPIKLVTNKEIIQTWFCPGTVELCTIRTSKH